MSDDTKSGYTKTGKKVMCINSNRRDLTYKKVYDVFTTQDSVDFIIDDVGDKRYESLEFPYWCENPDGMVDKANETKHKFKVGDNTESNYTKTDKKVKSIYDGRADLTYNEVYDVFIDNKGDEFIIDDVGDKRYWSVSDDEYYELVDDVVDNTHETKPKFKVGDKVKVVSTYYTSQFVDVINVGDTGITGVIISIDDNDYITPYLVKFDDSNVGDNWWFTDKCIELVNDDTDETKLKFKVGDKVRVVDIGFISKATSDTKVGDVGVIAYVDSDYVVSPYRVEFDDGAHWWFTDKCIELVNDDNTIENENSPIKSDGSQIVSDGGSSSYYAQQIPKGMLERFNATGIIEAKDVIRLFLGNDFNMGNIFKAYCRIISLRNGKGKAGIDEQYDLTKVKYFAEDELNHYLENKDV